MESSNARSELGSKFLFFAIPPQRPSDRCGGFLPILSTLRPLLYPVHRCDNSGRASPTSAHKVPPSFLKRERAGRQSTKRKKAARDVRGLLEVRGLID